MRRPTSRPCTFHRCFRLIYERRAVTFEVIVPLFEHLYYYARMDTTIRNLDEPAYRRLKARAALTGKNIGELLNDAIRAYLARPASGPKHGSLRDLTPELYPKGNERLSERVDAIVYGI